MPLVSVCCCARVSGTIVGARNERETPHGTDTESCGHRYRLTHTVLIQDVEQFWPHRRTIGGELDCVCEKGAARSGKCTGKQGWP